MSFLLSISPSNDLLLRSIVINRLFSKEARIPLIEHYLLTLSSCASKIVMIIVMKKIIMIAMTKIMIIAMTKIV